MWVDGTILVQVVVELNLKWLGLVLCGWLNRTSSQISTSYNLHQEQIRCDEYAEEEEEEETDVVNIFHRYSINRIKI